MAETAVAAAFKRHAPATACERAEAVAAGRCGGDTPTRCRRARSRRGGWTQQEERRAGTGGGKIEPAAHGQIEAALDRAGNRRCRNFRSKCFLHRPQRVLVETRLHEHQPADIEAEPVQPVAIGLPEIREATARSDENDRTATDRERADRQRHDEAERRCPVAMGRCDNLMEGATGQARAGEVAINLRQTERKMHRHRIGKRVLQPRDGLSKGGDMVAAAGARDWLHESELSRQRKKW